MCGIVGYMGSSGVASILLSGLKCLEYRGYDSAGIAYINNGKLNVTKSAGKLENLEKLLTVDRQSSLAFSGIGHTRWATHGVPNDLNAHPHLNADSSIAIVHNGIIENYALLKEELESEGYKFNSDTDTEVIVHLLTKEYKKTNSILKAITNSVKKLVGSYALGIISSYQKDTIFAVNHHYSLTLGQGDNEFYLASDIVAVRQYTNKILRLEQSEIAEITQNQVRLYDFNGHETMREFITVDSDPYLINKDGYKHFLLKEIHEQPTILRQTIGKYMVHPNAKINFNQNNEPLTNAHTQEKSAGVHLSKNDIMGVENILIIACGTAYHAGMIGKYYLEQLCNVPVNVEIASEVRGRNLLVNEKSLVIAVSQSGETADTIAALSEAKRKGAYTLGITNRADSHLSRISSNLIITECGVEVSVAATKTYIAQVVSFLLFALYLAEERGSLTTSYINNLKLELHSLPALVETVLANEAYIKEASIKYADAQDMVFIGRGINYPTALEGALKLKELSYIHASGYAAGELKHGPIAVLDSLVPVVTILMPGSVYDKTLSNAQEARARNAQMIAVACSDDEKAHKYFDTVLEVPPVDELLSPILAVIPLQLFSYFISDYLGKDVDQPRNLAKSVTVE